MDRYVSMQQQPRRRKIMLQTIKLLLHNASENLTTYKCTAIRNCSYSTSNHTSVLLPTPFSLGCCLLFVWSPPVSFPKLHRAGCVIIHKLSSGKLASGLPAVQGRPAESQLSEALPYLGPPQHSPPSLAFPIALPIPRSPLKTLLCRLSIGHGGVTG